MVCMWQVVVGDEGVRMIVVRKRKRRADEDGNWRWEKKVWEGKIEN